MLEQETLVDGSLRGGVRFAFCLQSFLAAAFTPGFKGPAGLFGEPLLEFGVQCRLIGRIKMAMASGLWGDGLGRIDPSLPVG